MIHGNKNRDIEALRAIGIIFVMIAHAYKLTPWQTPLDGSLHAIYYYFGWWTGVDLFFCVSGFIITSNIINNIKDNNSKSQLGFIAFAIPFWVKRIYRLWPSAWFWMTTMTILSVIFNKIGVFGTPINQILYQLYSMLNVANFYGHECVVSSMGYKACGVYQVYWSLSLEEQFYLLFPFIIYFLGKKKTLLLVLAIAAIQIPIDRGSSLLGFIRTDSICFGVAIGILATASWYPAIKPNLLNNNITSSIVIFILSVALLLLGSYKTMTVGFSTGMVAIVSGILVWIASFNSSLICPKGILGSVVLWFGSRSYALYLSHIPAYYLVIEAAHRILGGRYQSIQHPTLTFISCGVVMAVILAEFSFRLIESPLRLFGRKKAASIKLPQ